MDKTNWFRFPWLKNTFNKTNLDLENPHPSGGPINDPSSNYTHKYTSNNTYLDNFQEARSHNSNFGTEGEEILPNSSFEKTNLDLENSSPLGGPNRNWVSAEKNKIDGGQYHNQSPQNPISNLYYTEGQLLRDKKGEVVTKQLHEYTEQNTYLKSLKDDIPIQTPSNSGGGNFSGLVNAVKNLIKG